MANASTSTMSEVESTLQRIHKHPGVLGIIIAQNEGKGTRWIPTDEENPVIKQREAYSTYCSAVAQQARSAVRDLDPLDDLKFMRIRTKKVEIMIAPEKEYTIICIQDPTQAK
ncbi:putative Dynein light chain roadblock-type 2 [Blattamonas nauphoetae]|uniref:Dynein light chain roadblock n=1 Tax=Blattamonas nauphoetae TaxID=2049346 RepID=A0ABQ9YA07_9EUKA|nr:putative Dynein light chain roadblock-type 2 [Blattamonas nauphoetae]